MKNSTKKEIRAWLILAAFQLTWIIPCVYANKHQQPTEDAAIKQIHIETETIAKIEQEEIPTVQKPIREYFDVPLSHELQDFIFEECETHNIAPEIVISMIAQESNYKSDAIGDSGNSLGLMQIQPKWNQERMERLGCNDLLDPYQNIKVGIDVLCELIEENPDLYFVLMAYNGGRNYAYKRIESGEISDYALEVLERAQQLERIGG